MVAPGPRAQPVRLRVGDRAAATRRLPRPGNGRSGLVSTTTLFGVSTELSAHVDAAIAALAALVPLPSPTVAKEHLPYLYGLDAGRDTATYHQWLAINADRRFERRQALGERLAIAGGGPSISVVVPVYRPDGELLEACVASVLHQSYDRWQLCLCDDGSDDGVTPQLLDRIAQRDDRIVVVAMERNGGISAATNRAAAAATGDFLAFLDQDDEIEVDALIEVAAAIVDHDAADVLYTDQDKMDLEHVRSEPYFKSGWNPDLLLSNMYMAHLLVVRRELFERLGGLRSEFDGSQDYDLALRATEVAREIIHVPVVGYHWRRTPGSTALDYGAKPTADLAARRALAEALDRRGQPGVIEDGLLESTFRARRRLPSPEPSVTVIIPFHDAATLLGLCIESLVERAGYENYELLLVDNRSWEPETRALVQRLRRHPHVRIETYDHEFNWSAINNWAATKTDGELLLFMNSDIEARTDDWVAALAEHALRPEVGAVGARLLYPDGRVQHAGVVLGMGGGVAWHAFCFCPRDETGYFGHTHMVRNYAGVTGACLMVKRTTFEEVGGFDESMAVAFNDVDFCIKLHQRGLLNVYTPFAEFTHHEGASRGRGALEREETREMFRRYGDLIRNDPFFNPNLNPLRSEFQLTIAPQEEDLWARVL